MKKADIEKQQFSCPLQKQGCGGCPMLALPYEEQLRSTFTYVKGKQVQTGIYAQGTHWVIPVETCLLHQPVLDEAIEAVRKAVREFKYPVYDEDKKTGLVRHILVRHSLSEDQVLAVLVTRSESFWKKGAAALPENYHFYTEYQ